MEERVNSIRTTALLQRLFKASNLKCFLEKNKEHMQAPPLHAYLSELCRKAGCVPEQVIKKTSIERTYGHQIFNGLRNPSRDKIIQLAFGFGLDVSGTQKLMKAAQKSTLYPKFKRDAVIIYCLEHHYCELETQSVLQELKLTLLGGQKNE